MSLCGTRCHSGWLFLLPAFPHSRHGENSNLLLLSITTANTCRNAFTCRRYQSIHPDGMFFRFSIQSCYNFVPLNGFARLLLEFARPNVAVQSFVLIMLKKLPSIRHINVNVAMHTSYYIIQSIPTQCHYNNQAQIERFLFQFFPIIVSLPRRFQFILFALHFELGQLSRALNLE